MNEQHPAARNLTVSRLRSTRTDLGVVLMAEHTQGSRCLSPFPFASSIVEMPGGSAPPMGVSTALDTYGFESSF